ncbi:MAG: ATP-binding cassette domain-containing protein [Gammaproteobacteria bacterium]|nr:ATP-binding cassette domain-containing protein [Gammaproteobacteria bacterium]
MIQVQNILLKRGNKELFTGLTLSVHAGHCVGIVGRNGVGKSSLFLLLRERLIPEEGEVKVPKRWVIAHLQQESEVSERGALDWVLDGDRPLRAIEHRIARAEADGRHEQLALLYAELESIDGYTASTRAGQILHGLGFGGDDFVRPVRDFSGGWRIRLDLARTLMCRSDLLLLDEPTNHLDLDAVMWLAHWLNRRRETTLLISHDRDFLDRVATDVIHLEGGRARAYRGNYSAFERQRGEWLAQTRSEHDKQQRRIQEIEAFVQRFRAKASKARQAQSRLRQLERMQRVAPIQIEADYRFSFPGPVKSSDPLLRMDDAVLGHGNHAVLREVTLLLRPGDRIGLLGRNGAGKTTLLRSVAGQLALLGGERRIGSHASIGYFAQHTADALDARLSPLQQLAKVDDRRSERELRGFLGGWGFSGEMALSPIAFLSGGEKARVALAMLAWQRPALLLLDEPTNHLDLDMRAALSLALQNYDGALMVVSHDRHLLETVVDELWLVADGGVSVYEDGLDTYRDWLLGRRRKSADPGRATERRAVGATRPRQ